MNIIETKPVGKIILDKTTPNRQVRVEHYHIPYYQRGYRWETRHVEALLEDIDNFILSKQDNYCLQPIVVVPFDDEEGFASWEVIDGQQRLITLYIIFKHINKPKYSIIFGQRNLSTAFLENLSLDTLSDNDPDFHFMSNTYKVVAKWFKQKTENDIGYIDEFYTTVTRKVQVIWYQIEELKKLEKVDSIIIENKKIDIFNRLNIGKIPLTDAELIRALLLSKIKFGLTNREIDMRQAEISNQWSNIEEELRNESFWYFLTNTDQMEYSSRIEYIFNLIAQGDGKNYSTYLWFENEVKANPLDYDTDDKKQEIERDNTIKLWNRTKEIFSKFKSWYMNDTTYHYVGFLLAIKKYDSKFILSNSYISKPEFKKWLFSQIKHVMKGYNLYDLTYGRNTKNIETILLLFNVITCEKLCETTKNRFPFDQYKKVIADGGWSVEHIHAQQSEQMKDEKAIRNWVEETLKSLDKISTINKSASDALPDEQINIDIKPYVERLKKIVQSKKIDDDSFNVLKDEIILLFDSSSLHELDNLALLSSKNNSSLNNSIFPVKRDKIIELEKRGYFIPPCTRNLFLKFYSNSDTQPFYWSSEDKRLYFKEIENVLNPFLN